MSDLVIETKKLTKIYGEQTAVNSVNLHVKPGRIYGLLGRNGAGKTTIISGYYNANMFQVLIGVVILMVCVILSLLILKGLNRKTK